MLAPLVVLSCALFSVFPAVPWKSSIGPGSVAATTLGSRAANRLPTVITLGVMDNYSSSSNYTQSVYHFNSPYNLSANESLDFKQNKALAQFNIGVTNSSSAHDRLILSSTHFVANNDRRSAVVGFSIYFPYSYTKYGPMTIPAFQYYSISPLSTHHLQAFESAGNISLHSPHASHTSRSHAGLLELRQAKSSFIFPVFQDPVFAIGRVRHSKRVKKTTSFGSSVGRIIKCLNNSIYAAVVHIGSLLRPYSCILAKKFHVLSVIFPHLACEVPIAIEIFPPTPTFPYIPVQEDSGLGIYGVLICLLISITIPPPILRAKMLRAAADGTRTSSLDSAPILNDKAYVGETLEGDWSSPPPYTADISGTVMPDPDIPAQMTEIYDAFALELETMMQAGWLA